MEWLIQQASEAGPWGLVAAVCMTMLAGIGWVLWWVVQKLIHWGFREPGTDGKDDKGGWLTQAVASNIESTEKLTEASVRHDQHFKALLEGKGCYAQGCKNFVQLDPGGSGIHRGQ